jgi:hypothetical protein
VVAEEGGGWRGPRGSGNGRGRPTHADVHATQTLTAGPGVAGPRVAVGVGGRRWVEMLLPGRGGFGGLGRTAGDVRAARRNWKAAPRNDGTAPVRDERWRRIVQDFGLPLSTLDWTGRLTSFFLQFDRTSDLTRRDPWQESHGSLCEENCFGLPQVTTGGKNHWIPLAVFSFGPRSDYSKKNLCRQNIDYVKNTYMLSNLVDILGTSNSCLGLNW